MNHEEILTFWFNEIDSALWWKKDLQFDQLIRSRFGEVRSKAVQCECDSWRKTARGQLAEVIVLDQFSRNLYRDDPRAFASDSQALALAQVAIATGAEQKLTPIERNFLYMPFMHSESAVIHEAAVKLFTKNGLQSNLEFEFKHKKIIDQFGRYPHRNTILGRPSTDAEILFLHGPNSGF